MNNKTLEIRTIKTDASKHLANDLIIITECVVLRDGILVVINNGFLDL